MKVYDLNEVCELLKMNIQTIRIYIKEGKLKASKIGRKYIITEDDLKEFIESQRVTNIAEDTEEKK
ncbi:MAG: helix-turn-helix domain-containing protein [Bacilli bacterium]|nr:helix-turn-helix domain-containing protein [Bacilli bacterium]